MKEVSSFSMKDLLDAGVHYGHKTMRWNPKMAPFLFGSRDDIHIIDLQQTVPLLHRALQAVYEIVKNNGRVLFVGTKRQASDIISEYAKRCGQYYVNHRWLGGMLTNWDTISLRIKTLRDMTEKLEKVTAGTYHLTKKEVLDLTRKKEKLERSIGGIMDMGGKPDLLFIIDTNKEDLAVKEAMKLNIPVIAILDSNSDPDNITFPVPGNDDATRAIKLYCELISDCALAGIQSSLAASGVDLGEADKVIVENNAEGKGKEVKLGAAKKPVAKKPLSSTSKAKTTATTTAKKAKETKEESKDSGE